MKQNKTNLIGLVGKMRVGKDEVAQIIRYLTNDFTPKQPYAPYRKYESDWEVKKYADKLKDCLCILLGCTRAQLEDPIFKESELGPEWWYFDKKDGGVNYNMVPYNKGIEMGIQGHPFKPTVRDMIQKLGTELIRQQLHPNAWVNATFATYTEDWEITRRKQLNETIEDGLYDIGSGTELSCLTGKGGYIDFQIALEKEVRGQVGDTEKGDKWIISDVRFENEAKAIKDRGGILISVQRPFSMRYPDFSEYGRGWGYSDELETDHPEFHKKLVHRSETELDNIQCDYIIDNNGDIDALVEKVREILK